MAKNKTPHTTLIPAAARVARMLRRAGLAPYPGLIDPKGGKGGAFRIKVTSDPGRIRIRVAAGGVQELYLYGSVSLDKVVSILVAELGSQALEQVGGGSALPARVSGRQDKSP
ncbi:MAG: hypothetical protein HQL63_11200 [Magnetococcales bacterium]|nr:hypothetical protein [Magnetococcales bacterium]MBF0323184.1 hypothetical protein [Magnetococcales bacterium]